MFILDFPRARMRAHQYKHRLKIMWESEPFATLERKGMVNDDELDETG